jgi:hypothetical protein
MIGENKPVFERSPRERFTTYRLFLFHFENILREKGKTQTAILTQLFSEQRSFLPNVTPLRLSDADSRKIRKLLFNARNSEMVARLNSRFDPALRRVTNQWKPIQTYYASYFLLVPLRMIGAQSGSNKIDTHDKTLTFATDNLCANLPKPWRCRYNVEQGNWSGFPTSPEPHAKPGWNLERYTDSYHNFAQFLRTTGDHKREEKWSKVKVRKPKRGEKRPKKKSISVGYISFWDALWRIRRWANYLEAQALLEGQEETPAIEFDASINLVLMCSMAVLERVLSAHLGNEFMLQSYEDYMRTIGTSLAVELTKHLSVRRNLVCA